MVYRLRREPSVEVLEQSRSSFDGGLILYDARHDKGYSLVDCISMNTMHRLNDRARLVATPFRDTRNACPDFRQTPLTEKARNHRVLYSWC